VKGGAERSGGDLFLIIRGLELVHLSLLPALPATTDNLVRYRYLFEVLPICPDTARYQAPPVIQGSLSVATSVDSQREPSHSDNLSHTGYMLLEL